MSKNQIEKFISNSLKDIQNGLPKGFRIDDKIHFDMALITKSKAKGGIDIKLANVSADLESQSVHRIKFSVVDEEAQQKSWKLGKKMLQEFFMKLAQFDPEAQQVIEHKQVKKKGREQVKK